MQRRHFILTLGALTLTAGPSHAQDYPTKAVRLIDPYVPGGSTGVVSRVVSARFQEITSQPMVVENKPGAGSNIGSDIVAKASPDGYTLLLGTSSLAINPALYGNLSFDPIKHLAPIVTLIKTPNVLAVNPSVPAQNVKDLIAYARANPGKLNYGSSGNGATNHIGMELFKSMAQLDMVHVPFKGGGEAMTALLGGQVQVLLNPASTLVPQDKAGKLRIIAVGSASRIEGLDYPTVAESGLPGFESTVWFGLFAPARTPSNLIAKLNRDVNAILADKRTIETLQGAGLIPVGGPPDGLRSLLADDTTRWTALIRSAGIRIQ